MQVTITINPELIQQVSDMVFEDHGVRPTEAQLREFFEFDVVACYDMQQDNGLDDAVESFFYFLAKADA